MGCRKGVFLGFVTILLFLAPAVLCAQPVFEIKKMEEQKAPAFRPHFFWERYKQTMPILKCMWLAPTLLHTQPDSAERVITVIYRESKAIHFYAGMMHSLCLMSALQYKRGNFDSSIALLKAAVPISKLAGQNSEHTLYINIANIFWAKGNYEEALAANYRAIDAMNTSNLELSTQDSASLFYNIAGLWHHLGESFRTMENLAILKRISFSTGTATALLQYYTALTNVSPNLTDDQKLMYFGEIVRLSRQSNNQELLVSGLNELCSFYIEKGQPDSATLYLNGALKELGRDCTTRNTCFFNTYINQGRLLQMKKEYPAAEKVFEDIYAKAKSLQLEDITLSMEPHMAAFYSSVGAYDKAYEHMKQYAHSQKTVLSQQKTRSVNNWMKSRIVEKDKQLLKKQLLISQQDRQLQNKNFWIMAIAFFCLLLCSILMFFIHSYRSRQKQQQSAIAQLQQAQQINQLKAQVRGEEQERNRIATDLHDGIASQLWAMKLNLDDVLKDIEGYSQQRLQSIYSHLDVVAQEIRETAHNLMPGLLLEEGLSKALSTLCKRIEKCGHLEVEFQEYGIIPDLDMEIQLSMYRMIQELIQNALKHANATLLLVQLSCVNTLLNITVEDNGSGAAINIREGLGLTNIQRRVKALQGQFDLKSKPGKGTNIYMEFDIRYFPAAHMVE